MQVPEHSLNSIDQFYFFFLRLIEARNLKLHYLNH